VREPRGIDWYYHATEEEREWLEMKIVTKSKCTEAGHIDYVHPQNKYAYCKTCRDIRVASQRKVEKRKAVSQQKRAERAVVAQAVAQQTADKQKSNKLVKSIIVLMGEDIALQRKVLEFILEQ
jgi:hypothetical protein